MSTLIGIIFASGTLLHMLSYIVNIIEKLERTGCPDNKFLKNLDLDLLLTNPDSLPFKCNNSHFADRHHKHIVTGDLRMNH